MAPIDVIVVGSGISGTAVAKTLVDHGVRTQMIDIGFDDPSLRRLIPDMPYSELRRTDPSQARYFIGDRLQGVPPQGIKVGAQLTPPRQFIHRDAEYLLPFVPGGFTPLQSTSLGGLGAGWGAACSMFSAAELSAAGLPVDDFPALYRCAASMIGISADLDSPVAQWLWSPAVPVQPPLDVDENARRILDRADRVQNRLVRLGVHVGSIPMAILTQDVPPRRANPYYDMDFYGDSGMSVFRPRYLVSEMMTRENFSYTPGYAVVRVSRTPEYVEVAARSTRSQEIVCFTAKRVVLCAGAINTGRIALNSLGLVNRRTTLLCNPYTYFPCVNLAMLGRIATERRHSLAQFGGVLLSPERDSVDGVFQMYSYRSLLLFKLAKEMPLPPRYGLLVARALVNALAIFGLFFKDVQSNQKSLQILPGPADQPPTLAFDYNLSSDEAEWRRQSEERFRRALFAMGCVPMGRIHPGHAGSIHYAGTVPVFNPLIPGFHTNATGEIDPLPGVYAGDSAPWTFLPAKGLSFTLAANGIRVARNVLETL
jgi:hypothetical protein